MIWLYDLILEWGENFYMRRWMKSKQFNEMVDRLDKKTGECK